MNESEKVETSLFIFTWLKQYIHTVLHMYTHLRSTPSNKMLPQPTLTFCRRCLVTLTYWRAIYYIDVIMGAMASQITSLTIIYSTVYTGADQRKHQSSVSLTFVWIIHRWPVNSPHKWPVTRKKFPFDDVIMISARFLPWDSILDYTYFTRQDTASSRTVTLVMGYSAKFSTNYKINAKWTIMYFVKWTVVSNCIEAGYITSLNPVVRHVVGVLRGWINSVYVTNVASLNMVCQIYCGHPHNTREHWMFQTGLNSEIKLF